MQHAAAVAAEIGPGDLTRENHQPPFWVSSRTAVAICFLQGGVAVVCSSFGW